MPKLAKRERGPLHARNGVKLDTVMGIAREMGRLIRLSYNGHLSIQELTGYVYALDKTRACLESAINLEVQAAANAPKPPPPPTTVNILTVPSGTFLNEATMQRLNEQSDHFPRTPLIEYAELGPTSAPVEAPVVSEPCEAQSSEEEDRIIDNLKREINELARKVGVDVVV